MKELFSKYGAVVFNFVFADDQNNIGFYAPALIPNRSNLYDSKRSIKVGYTGESEWNGFLDFTKSPHLFNPDKGYIITANNRQGSHNSVFGSLSCGTG